jgi:hypothetical protein
MKILYALQATGNGHNSRANEILPLLEKMAEVDLLLSVTQADVGLQHSIKYQKKGLSFVFGKKGGVDLLKTFQQMKTKRFLDEVRSIPVEEYDFVINDFEPLSAWACKNKNVTSNTKKKYIEDGVISVYSVDNLNQNIASVNISNKVKNFNSDKKTQLRRLPTFSDPRALKRI